jgi:copper chaperone CopZ
MRNATLALLTVLVLAGCPATEAETPTTAAATLQVQAAAPPAEATDTSSPSLQVVTSTFDVTGMTCADCSKAIETKLIGMAGVTTVSADDKAGRAIVQYDEGKVSQDDIIAAIDSLNFTAKVATN